MGSLCPPEPLRLMMEQGRPQVCMTKAFLTVLTASPSLNVTSRIAIVGGTKSGVFTKTDIFRGTARSLDRFVNLEVSRDYRQANTFF